MTDQHEKEWIYSLYKYPEQGNGERVFVHETSVDAVTEEEAKRTAVEVFMEMYPDMGKETIEENMELDDWNYTEDSVNKILNRIGANGKRIDVFDLHGVVFIGTVTNGAWNLTECYKMFSEHSISLNPEDFKECRSPEDVEEKYGELIGERIKEELA